MGDLVSFGDPEWALASAITEVLERHGVDADPIAGSLPADLPSVSVHVEVVGGDPLNVGVELWLMKAHSRAKSEGEALRLADKVRGALTVLDLEQIQGDATIVGLSPVNVPHANPDPRNPSFYRFSQSVQATVKAT